MHGSRFDFGPSDQTRLPPPSIEMQRVNSDRKRDTRWLAEETPVALVYDGTTVAVVMATPADLVDFAVGFSLTEGIIREPGEISELNVVPGPDGVELRVWLRADRGARFKARQRRMVGPTGCGLCGIESLSEAARRPPAVSRQLCLTPSQISQAVDALVASQSLNRKTRAVHAAGFYRPEHDKIITREDVGRHNALDKLAGALAVANLTGDTGAVILTSRISVEMIQKTAHIGASVVVGVSAPTALAVRIAEVCKMTLIGVARGSDFEIFTHPEAVVPA